MLLKVYVWEVVAAQRLWKCGRRMAGETKIKLSSKRLRLMIAEARSEVGACVAPFDDSARIVRG